ncbi:hypothetical protein G7Y79_00001g001580 [Physcia stellaris]|nr:hypothetical protein G7Y79_00001g001580 [Physcia stellaris]
MISLRNDFLNFSRKADAKIGLLREVIERVQRGEEVDVEGLLGTGDEEKEREWEEVIREIEEADLHWDPKVRKRKDKQAGRIEEEHASASRDNEASIGTEPGKSSDRSSSLNAAESESTRRDFY